MGRNWQSPLGNLYASTLVRLWPSDRDPATLALVAAVALVETAKVFAPNLPIHIKWPNDLMIDGAKLSGILLERGGEAVVVGMGVNIAHHPDLPDRPAMSLAAQGVQIEPGAFCDVLAESFARWLSRWRSEGLEPIRRAWLAAAHPLGTALTVSLGDGDRLEGLFAGLDNDGALSLRLADGSLRAIHAGDVFLM
jgi:BirA family transcriptional regulator, biotin operon repressor / biotin---[acetyl-CoA-carboxylase] ligase